MSRLEDMAAARRRAELVSRMRGMARSSAPAAGASAQGSYQPDERCELCGASVPDDHRHLLDLEERRILCACEACWAMRSGDPGYRPAGLRTLWLEDFQCSEDRWASFQIPIGLAFFMRSGTTGGIVALYPSLVGATESELDLAAWDALAAENPRLNDLEPDAEALVVNRLVEEPQYAIVPIDDCYRLVGLIKSRWEGISGGSALEEAVPAFFKDIHTRAQAFAGAGR